MCKQLIVLFCLSLISLTVSAKDYKGAELRTKEAYVYGRFEVRYKASAGNGHVSTFFTYHEITTTANWNEIDIEIHGRYKDDVQVTTITPNQTIHLRHQYVNFNPHEDFNTYAFEWTPDYVAWFIDDEEVYRQTEDHIQTLTRPQKIMMNIWNPVYEDWVGPWDDRILPRFAYYDYVSYSSYTPGSGNVGTDSNFTFQWQDDFDSWDQNRWEKATHTFQGNNCDFIPENVVFRDGHMILCLTDNSNTGYLDKESPAVLWARADGDQIWVRFTEELDKVTAEKKSNYIISGVNIQDAQLHNDQRTVVLTADNLDLTKSYSMIVLGIKDDFPGNNTILGQSINIIMPKPLNTPVKINVGGKAYEDYLPDQEWGPDREYGYQDGSSSYINFPVESTEEDVVYKSDISGLAAYRIRVSSGVYNIKLMMTEHYFTSAGKRYFDIFLEDKQIADHLDLFETAGLHTAYELNEKNVTIKDGKIDIHFCASANKPLLNGIVVEVVETKVGQQKTDPPEQFMLFQNYPNPFNAATSISYYLAENAYVSLSIYDSCGKKIEQLIDQSQESGTHKATWESQSPSGIYFYKLDIRTKDRKFTKKQKMILLK